MTISSPFHSNHVGTTRGRAVGRHVGEPGRDRGGEQPLGQVGVQEPQISLGERSVSAVLWSWFLASVSAFLQGTC